LPLFYKPSDGWAADVIPFYRRGEYHLFYLKDYRDIAGHGEGTPWFHLSTRDFVTFEDHGEALPRGTKDEQDLFVFTGSVIEKDGRFHIFYTGHNPHFRRQGRPEQAVMHAISDDLDTWRKLPADTIPVPASGYEPHDWRDPFVFWNDEAGEYWMLLAARHNQGAPRRRGCTALCASPDLVSWELRAPLWSPNLFYTHECPDLFRMGDWWYLVFSEFSEATVTRYRMARSSSGPWFAPPNDTFDGRAFYAAKTASDGARRFLFGWNPTRAGDQNYSAVHWGGNLIVHELSQACDGTLTVQPPDTITRAFAALLPSTFSAAAPFVAVSDRTVTIDSRHGFQAALVGGLPTSCRITTTIVFRAGTVSFGLMLRADEAGDTAYFVRFEPARNRLVLDSWPRPGDVPFMIELERPILLTPETPISLEILLDETVCEIYAGGTIAMSARLYPLSAASLGHMATEEGTLTAEFDNRGDASVTYWGLFVAEGTASFQDQRVYLRAPA
jgi:beta-fructofuranosidase